LNKKNSNKSSENENEDLLDIDKELNDLININESLKQGISKLRSEMEKDISNINKSNK
jgi:hypothetical protein